jgi:hypothetical protein
LRAVWEGLIAEWLVLSGRNRLGFSPDAMAWVAKCRLTAFGKEVLRTMSHGVGWSSTASVTSTTEWLMMIWMVCSTLPSQWFCTPARLNHCYDSTNSSCFIERGLYSACENSIGVITVIRHIYE